MAVKTIMSRAQCKDDSRITNIKNFIRQQMERLKTCYMIFANGKSITFFPTTEPDKDNKPGEIKAVWSHAYALHPVQILTVLHGMSEELEQQYVAMGLIKRRKNPIEELMSMLQDSVPPPTQSLN